MKKLVLSIIGIISIALSVTVAYADDCTSSAYDKIFNCKAKKIYSYCAPDAKLARQTPSFNLYEGAYCNQLADNDDDIYKTVAEQFKIEDPKMDKDKIKKILTDKIDPAYDRVKTAYGREKIMAQTKQSLKQQFSGSEIWYNGKLSDSPFDLVVDLNLIEIVLFGSKAQWQDDVWKFPKDRNTDNTSDNGITPGQTITGPETPPAGEGTPETPTPTAQTPPDQYECVPNDTLGGILGGAQNPNTGATPPEQIPVLCGNGKIDSGETCDDGNNIAGDGCSENCQKEDGADLSCKDNEAVTFKQLSKTPVTNPAPNTQTPSPATPPAPAASPSDTPP